MILFVTRPTATRCEPRPAGRERRGTVEAHAVRGGLPALHGPGEAEVRCPGVEHPLRIQPGGL